MHKGCNLTNERKKKNIRQRLSSTMFLSLVFLMIYSLFTSCYANTSNENNLPAFMQHHGYIVIDFTQSNNNQNIDLKTSLCNLRCKQFNLTIDLGDPNIFVNEEIVKELGLIPTINGGLDTMMSKVCLEAMCISNVPAYWSENAVPGKSSHLGLEFLKQLNAIIDLNSKKIYIPTTDSSASLAGWLYSDASYQKIPMTIIEHHIIVPVSVNHLKQKNFLFDTGVITLIDENYARKQKIKILNDTCFSGQAQPGKITLCPIKPGEIKTLDPNNTNNTFISQTINITDLSFVMPGYHIKGILGLDWMLGNQAVIDFSQHALWLRTQSS